MSVTDDVSMIGLSNPLLQDRLCASHQSAQAEARAFIESASVLRSHSAKSILITHIPLHSRVRDAGGECGGPVKRRDFRLHSGRGGSWENVMDADLTRVVLEKLRPTVVFSGDAHDLCIVEVCVSLKRIL